MYIHLSMHIHTLSLSLSHTHAHTHTHTHTHKFTCLHAQEGIDLFQVHVLCVCVCVCVCVCACVRVCVCVCVCGSVCICICIDTYITYMCIYMYVKIYTHAHTHVYTHTEASMGWLRLVGSLKWEVSFAEEPYKRVYILQKRPITLRSLLIVATPYLLHVHILCVYVRVYMRVRARAWVFVSVCVYEFACVYVCAWQKCISFHSLWCWFFLSILNPEWIRELQVWILNGSDCTLNAKWIKELQENSERSTALVPLWYECVYIYVVCEVERVLSVLWGGNN